MINRKSRKGKSRKGKSHTHKHPLKRSIKRNIRRSTKQTRKHRSHSKRHFMSRKKRLHFMGGGIGETVKTVDGMPIAKKDVIIASSDGGVRTVAEYEEHALMRNQQGDDLY